MTQKRVAVIATKGTLDMAYPPFILGSTAAALDFEVQNRLVRAGGNRAFVTTAHRGQHRTHASIANVPGAGDPQLTTPGVPRADVWVFNPANLGESLGGTPQKIISLFGDTPRALAVSPDRRAPVEARAAAGLDEVLRGECGRAHRLVHALDLRD